MGGYGIKRYLDIMIFKYPPIVYQCASDGWDFFFPFFHLITRGNRKCSCCQLRHIYAHHIYRDMGIGLKGNCLYLGHIIRKKMKRKLKEYKMCATEKVLLFSFLMRISNIQL